MTRVVEFMSIESVRFERLLDLALDGVTKLSIVPIMSIVPWIRWSRAREMSLRTNPTEKHLLDRLNTGIGEELGGADVTNQDGLISLAFVSHLHLCSFVLASDIGTRHESFRFARWRSKPSRSRNRWRGKSVTSQRDVSGVLLLLSLSARCQSALCSRT